MGAGVQAKRSQPGRRSRRRSVMMSEINVTPFVDVMLVLLIVFMVSAPMLTVGVDVELPETAAGALPTEQEPPLAVSILADGRIMIQDLEVPRESLVTKLQSVAAEREGDRVFVRADQSVSYEVVAQVMGALDAGGFNSIGLVTDGNGPLFNAVQE